MWAFYAAARRWAVPLGSQRCPHVRKLEGELIAFSSGYRGLASCYPEKVRFILALFTLMCDGVREQGKELETSIAPHSLRQAVWPEHGRERLALRHWP